GRLITYPADVAMTVAATIDLTSVPDLEAPTLSLSASSDLADPWASLWIVASEPLPGDQMAPVLQAGSGEVVTFDGVPTGADTTFAVLEKPRRLLRYHETYQITFDTLTDFAGNPARWSNDRAFFTTRDAPPLVAADGFESTMDETVGGAQILSGAGAPTITGARSLYIPPAASLGAAGFATQLAMRLPIPAGARMLRFAYRIVDPGPDSGTFYVIGSVGGTLVNVSLSSNAEGVTYATIGQDRVGLAPMITAAIALPPDVHDDIVFVRIASQAGSCAGPPPPPVPGIILDDMRAE
ncbi:MAG TPA: hypothetical protein VN903_29900, partial [Polyangia bacterium]|nr:hypothetical protein [Polyangia bacterium]